MQVTTGQDVWSLKAATGCGERLQVVVVKSRQSPAEGFSRGMGVGKAARDDPPRAWVDGWKGCIAETLPCTHTARTPRVSYS